MTFGELKNQIRDLGFEEDATMDETRELVINACNRAIDLINTTIRPIVKNVTVTVPEGLEDQTYQTANMTDYAEDFVDFYGKPRFEKDGAYIALSDMEMLAPTVFQYKTEYAPLYVPYKALPTPITTDTDDDFEIELDKIVQPLIALLASYYIWLDDDERKATMYYNQYDDMKNQILGNMAFPKTVKFSGGI